MANKDPGRAAWQRFYKLVQFPSHWDPYWENAVIHRVRVHPSKAAWVVELEVQRALPSELEQKVRAHVKEHFQPQIDVTLQLSVPPPMPAPPPPNTQPAPIYTPPPPRTASSPPNRSVSPRRSGITPLHKVPAEGPVCVEGQIFKKELRALRNKQSLLTLWLAGDESALIGKIFLRQRNSPSIWADVKEGDWLQVQGIMQMDSFLRDHVLMMHQGKKISPKEARRDEAVVSRVELHAHTTMSSMDGMVEAKTLVKRAAAWGHPAIAITDHGGIQAFPEAVEAGKAAGIKTILGMEAYVAELVPEVVSPAPPLALEGATYVVLDVETTGLAAPHDALIEVAAVRYREGAIVERFQALIHPERDIPPKVTELTQITPEMLEDAPRVEEVFPRFLAFLGQDILVAHNARFDAAFLHSTAERLGLEPPQQPMLDTLMLARRILPSLKNHRLPTLTTHFRVSLQQHHRAIQDAEATAHVLDHLLRAAREEYNVATLADLNTLLPPADIRKLRPFHATLLVKNAEGLRNLYRLVSESHLEHFFRTPRLPKASLAHYREGLLLGSGCGQGEVYEAAVHRTAAEVEALAQFYDYLEIQPPDLYQPWLARGVIETEAQLHAANRLVVAVGKKLGKPVVATGNAHYLDPQDAIYRDIIVGTQSGFRTPLPLPPMHLRTTAEMLEAFAHLGPEVAKEVVITAPRALAAQIDPPVLFPAGTATPQWEGAEEELTQRCYQQAHAWYGDPLPAVVQKRLERELQSIIQNNFAAIYLIAQRLVSHSLQDGYLVGSRGSVGSSLVATLSGITEVNPLAPHWRCSACQYSEFLDDGSYESGFDLPAKACPRCEQTLDQDGQQIPFETFLGFEADKTPDIDLNFGSDYQAKAHAHAEEMFGKDRIYRAGTISRIKGKTAYALVRKYEEHEGKILRAAEVERLLLGCTGIKRTTGQHPGGLMVIPEGVDVHSFTPIQYPADDRKSGVQTTHFDYQAISGKLLKLDVLGHQDPTTIRLLQDITGVDLATISWNDPDVLALFHSTESLGIAPEDICGVKTGVLGIPEFGTPFVRQMLEETRPRTFGELIRISGLSHGTDVWMGNAQELIQNKTCTLSEAICTRDDIMVYLMRQGCPAAAAFRIMENVRKGRGVTEEEEGMLKKHGVPSWYIHSCQQISYMFPRAHAAAYVMMAFRIAWFKVHHPIAYYATYFRRLISDFDWPTITKGSNHVRRALTNLQMQGNQISIKEKGQLQVFESVLEMYARNLSFSPISLYESEAKTFAIKDQQLIPPFTVLSGVGENVATSIVEARKDGPFLSLANIQARTRAGSAVLEVLRNAGCLGDLPESNQLSLF